MAKRRLLGMIGALFMAGIIPAGAQEGSGGDWDLGQLAVGKRYPTTISARNRCPKTHRFEVTLRDLPWIHLLDPAKFKVKAGATHTVRVEVDTRGLKAGSYQGRVIIRCLSCKAPKCMQDRDILTVRMNLPAAETSAVSAADTPEEILKGFRRNWGLPGFTPRTPEGIKAKGPCDELYRRWVKAVQGINDSRPDCDEKRREMERAKSEARAAEQQARDAAAERDRLKGKRKEAKKAFDKAQRRHDTFIRQILQGVQGISFDKPFPGNPRGYWPGGYRWGGATMPAGGLYYDASGRGLLAMGKQLDQWRKQVDFVEKLLTEKKKALNEADEALKQAEQRANDADVNAAKKKKAAERATRAYVDCLRSLREGATVADNLRSKAEDCLRIARAAEAAALQKRRAETERLAKIEAEKKRKAREEAARKRRLASLPKPVPILEHPQVLNGGLKQVRFHLASHLKSKARDMWTGQNNVDPCHLKCLKVAQSIASEGVAEVVGDIGYGVMTGALNALPAETLVQKVAVQGVKGLLGLAQGKGAATVLTDRAAALVGGALLPKVYGRWLGGQINKLATVNAVDELRRALKEGGIQVYQSEKATVRAHDPESGRWFNCPASMRLLYSPKTGYVVGVVRCRCPGCPTAPLIFRYKVNADGVPVTEIEII